MAEKHLLGPESIANFQLGKKIIIIDPSGHDITLLLKCKKVYQEELPSNIDISTLPPIERRIAEYITKLDSRPGYLGKVMKPDELLLDEIFAAPAQQKSRKNKK